ncbi:MAG: ABC transporter substrate-binding protein [Desulfovibrionaceae bacterium]|nr:ABC transporter substrate-binding protein [Desulfovibrionaceae bacterium]
MKRLPALLTLCLCLLFAAAPALAEEAPPKVLFLTPSQPGENSFWARFTDFMRVAADDLGIELEVVYSKDRFSVVDNARRAIYRPAPPDYVVFIYQAKNSLDMLDMLDRADIKSVICNTDVIAAERNAAGSPRGRHKNWIGHLFPDDILAGRMLADRLIKRGFELGLTDNDGVLHLPGIGGSRDTTSGLHRKKGLEQAINRTPKVFLERYVWTDWTRDTARTKTLRLLDMYPDCRVFWSIHDETALGTLDAADAKGFHPRKNFLAGGVGWAEEGLDAVRDGRLEALVGGHFMDGAWSLIMIFDYHNGHDFADPLPTLHSEMRLLDQDNVDDYLPLLDRANWKRIDFGQFTKTRNPRRTRYDFNPDAVLRQLNGK